MSRLLNKQTSSEAQQFLRAAACKRTYDITTGLQREKAAKMISSEDDEDTDTSIIDGLSTDRTDGTTTDQMDTDRTDRDQTKRVGTDTDHTDKVRTDTDHTDTVRTDTDQTDTDGTDAYRAYRKHMQKSKYIDYTIKEGDTSESTTLVESINITGSGSDGEDGNKPP